MNSGEAPKILWFIDNGERGQASNLMGLHKGQTKEISSGWGEDELEKSFMTIWTLLYWVIRFFERLGNSHRESGRFNLFQTRRIVIHSNPLVK